VSDREPSWIAARLVGLRRRVLSYRYLSGRGLEIGALTAPMRVSRRAQVRYVDRLDSAGLLEQYPDTPPDQLVPIDIVDNGETLATQPENSADFIIANHFIEHTENPIATLQNLCRVLKPGGSLFMAVPDRHHTFDRHRPPTPVEHLMRDWEEGPAWSRRAHQEEWARLVENAPEDKVAWRADQIDTLDYAIHYHVWDRKEFAQLIEHAQQRVGLAMRRSVIVGNGGEFLVVLRKSRPAA
jgi:SAM-dependent methyltransferase